MHTVEVALLGRAYRAQIGAGLLGDPALWRELVGTGPVLLVTDAVVGPLHAGRLATILGTDRVLTLPAGEPHKTLASVERVWDALDAGGHGRDSTIVALGGGVVGDLAGFAAATWHRGITIVHAPTTLLAMVDSAIGGKTAVNRAGGKNLVGAFHQPRGVVIDVDALATLDPREHRAGLGEVIKYGAGLDAELFRRLEDGLDPLLAREPSASGEVIARCCALKAALVVEDEHDRGRRTLLNLGHTFGHALEDLLGFGTWRHGEAVGCGVAMAARASATLGLLDAGAATRIERLVARAGLPTAPPPEVAPAALAARFARDKKARGGRPRFVLLEAIGRAVVVDDLPDAALAVACAPGTHVA